ncbi:DUF4394 domain-containing protein [Penaeicola halotolerans]|uniref:DUF4394 domain-containing protein n=1 Tax=Penaeicola halotolerans TaxID=2793196 RepID=UPI001CF85744|nr:DUF4394 domain-containing protein [Penaeicola halotolerans]
MSYNNLKNSLRLAGLLVLSGVIFSCNDDDTPAPVEMPGMAPEVVITTLTEDNRILWYNADQLNNPTSSVEVSGLASGESLLSIDYRPATGQLYALGSSSRVYIINETSGAATALGQSSFSPALASEVASLDFNPTVDRIRVVTGNGQNLRLHPELGTVVAIDGSINGGMSPSIRAVAYTNSVAGASSTQLYDIDFNADKIYLQNPPNDGGLQEVGDLGVDFEGVGAFDIQSDNEVALAVVRNDVDSRLYTINLESGAAEWVGTFGQPVISLAIKTEPVAYASTADNQLQRFNPTTASMNPIAFAGLMEGETIIGLDFRPVNGQLYALSSMSQLYTVNTANGQLTAVGDGLTPQLEGEAFGFDFNPTVDRIRLVSNTGQNLRLHPDLGTVVATDGDLNPGTPSVTAAAYTNSFAGTTSTVLYVIDSENDMLYRQDPPNDGVLVPIGALGIDVTSANGFDIGGLSNEGYGLLTVGNTTSVYRINLSTGAATKVADFQFAAQAMALGLGF